MFEAITAWSERLKAERKILSPIASDIEFMCRAFTDAKHGNFWEFGLPRLYELLKARFAAEDEALFVLGTDEQLELHRHEHELILATLEDFQARYEQGALQGLSLRDAEREFLHFLDDDLADHFFDTDEDARRRSQEKGLIFP